MRCCPRPPIGWLFLSTSNAPVRISVIVNPIHISHLSANFWRCLIWVELHQSVQSVNYYSSLCLLPPRASNTFGNGGMRPVGTVQATSSVFLEGTVAMEIQFDIACSGQRKVSWSCQYILLPAGSSHLPINEILNLQDNDFSSCPSLMTLMPLS